MRQSEAMGFPWPLRHIESLQLIRGIVMLVEELVLMDISAGFIQHGVEPSFVAIRQAFGDAGIIQRTIDDPRVTDEFAGVLQFYWEDAHTAGIGELKWIKMAWLLDQFQTSQFYDRGKTVLQVAIKNAHDYAETPIV